VPTADVVVTNPTHYAVALKYADGQMGAPRVVAKGADEVAAKIRELAKENKVAAAGSAGAGACAVQAHRDRRRNSRSAVLGRGRSAGLCVPAARLQQGRRPVSGSSDKLPVPPELDPHNPASPPATKQRSCNEQFETACLDGGMKGAAATRWPRRSSSSCCCR
jgi:flagellar biosynthetic protein FlhB